MYGLGGLLLGRVAIVILYEEVTVSVYYAGFIPCDGVYAVLFPDIQGCNSQGDTLVDAFSMAADALAGHLSALVNDADDIPVPSTRENALKALKEQYAALDLGPLPEGTMLHPVPTPNLDMRTKQVSVSLRKYSLDMIDRKAREVGMTRSGFLVVAASAFESRV